MVMGISAEIPIPSFHKVALDTEHLFLYYSEHMSGLSGLLPNRI